MILGLGFDIVEIPRMARAWERFGAKFAGKILHPEELAALPGSPAPESATAAFLASRFAAKEAAVKALGTGFAEGIGMGDIQVKNAPSGKPELLLHNSAARRFTALGGTGIFLSLSHEKNTAGAVVILEG